MSDEILTSSSASSTTSLDANTNKTPIKANNESNNSSMSSPSRSNSNSDNHANNAKHFFIHSNSLHSNDSSHSIQSMKRPNQYGNHSPSINRQTSLASLTAVRCEILL